MDPAGTITDRDWLTFAGALVGALVLLTAAVIAAVTAGRRQQRQLDAEADRSRRQLEAEHVRLRMTLAHDRELADLSDLRLVFEDAVRSLRRGAVVLDAAQSSFSKYGAEIRHEDIEALESMESADADMQAVLPRLTMRLGGDEDPASLAFVRALGEFALAHGYLYVGDDAFAAAKAAITQARSAFDLRQEEFEHAAREKVGSRIAAPEPPPVRGVVVSEARLADHHPS